MPSNIVIKQATPADIPDLLQLIHDLAVYEKEPEAVVNTPELMQKALFEDKYAESLIARTPEGMAVGICLYFFTYSTWLGRPGVYLEDLYVDPEYRKDGLGKRFFGHLGKVAQEKNAARIEWRVLKWNTPSIDFYEKRLGATPQSEWEMERIEGAEDIAKLAALYTES